MGRVIIDNTWFGRERLTAHDGTTLVYQPYMSEIQWEQKKMEFLAQHEPKHQDFIQSNGWRN